MQTMRATRRMMQAGQNRPTKQTTARSAGARDFIFCVILGGVMILPASASSLFVEVPSAASASSSHDHPPGYLGIEFRDATNDQIVALHLPVKHGVEVFMVDHDGPAGQAGLQPHDLLLKIDSKEIEHADDLRKRIHDSEPGTVVTLMVARQGRVMVITAKLANREELERKAWLDNVTLPPPPEPAQQPIVIEQYNGETNAPESASPGSVHGQSFLGSVLHLAPYTGLELQAMEPQLAGFFGAPPHTGLLVHAVDDNSPGSTAGLRAGDVVLKVNSARVKSTSDWIKQVRAAKGGPVVLIILRDKHEQQVTLTPEAKKHSLLEWPAVSAFRSHN